MGVSAGLLLLAGAMSISAQAHPVTVVINTELGSIEAEIDTVHAPVTSANFLRYVDRGWYSGGDFHRTLKLDNQPKDAVKIEAVQAGLGVGTPAFAAIPLERTSVTGILHTDGTLSMERGEPDTAASEFMICIGDQPSLDFGGKRNPDGQGYAAFGHVVKGMDIVRKIQQSPAKEQDLTPPIRILGISRK